MSKARINRQQAEAFCDSAQKALTEIATFIELAQKAKGRGRLEDVTLLLEACMSAVEFWTDEFYTQEERLLGSLNRGAA